VFNYLSGVRIAVLLNNLIVKGNGKGKFHPMAGHEGPDV
jgi:hypothetical protein